MAPTTESVKAQLAAIGYNPEHVPEDVIRGFLQELEEHGAEGGNSEAASDVHVPEERPQQRPSTAPSAPASSRNRAKTKTDRVARYEAMRRFWDGDSYLRNSACPRRRQGFYERFRALHELEREQTGMRKKAAMNNAMHSYSQLRSYAPPGEQAHKGVRMAVHQRLRAGC